MLTLRYRSNLESYIHKIIKLSDKATHLDTLSLKTLKSHVDALFKEILQSYKEREEALKSTLNENSHNSLEQQVIFSFILVKQKKTKCFVYYLRT